MYCSLQNNTESFRRTQGRKDNKVVVVMLIKSTVMDFLETTPHISLKSDIFITTLILFYKQRSNFQPLENFQILEVVA